MPHWDEIVEQHSDRVFRYAYKLTGNRADAEDLSQEVFARVFRSLQTYEEGNFEGWLYRITTNVFLDQARRKQRIRFVGLPEDFDARSVGRLFSRNHGASAESRALAGLFDEEIEAALASLPVNFRTAVVLSDVEGLSHDEISELLGVKVATVRTRVHRGRLLLRKALEHRAPKTPRGRALGPRLAPGF